MVNKFNVCDQKLRDWVNHSYGFIIHEAMFLPIGADCNTAVCKIITNNNLCLFLKLRKNFVEASVQIPKYLADLGFKHVVAPIENKYGQLWSFFDAYYAVLYQYIEGSNAIESPLSETQWIALGQTIKMLHQTHIPLNIVNIPKEEFDSPWINIVKNFLSNIETVQFTLPLAINTSIFLQSKKEGLVTLIQYIEHLLIEIKKKNPMYVLCHADLHGWNLMISQKNFYIVDWDTVLFAPKERDLMFINAGIWDTGLQNGKDEALFYKGYGDQTAVDYELITYYRFERILQDIGEYCKVIFEAKETEDNSDMLRAFHYLKTNFLPGGTIEKAFASHNKNMY